MYSLHDRVIVDNMSEFDKRETKSNIKKTKPWTLEVALRPSGVLLAFIHQHLPDASGILPSAWYPVGARCYFDVSNVHEALQP